MSREELIVNMAKAMGCGAIATEPYWLASVPAAERALAVIEELGQQVRAR